MTEKAIETMTDQTDQINQNAAHLYCAGIYMASKITDLKFAELNEFVIVCG
jgi:hypothetical protein